MKPPLRLPLDAIAPGLRVLPPEAATYVTRVHRLGAGDRILVFDPDLAIEADAEIAEAERRGVVAHIGDVRPAQRRPARSVTLVQGIGKGDKLDAIVRDATELGATRIVPALCERSVARPDPPRAARWRRIAVDAARQCGRGDAPLIDAPVGFAEALLLTNDPPALSLCLDPAADQPLGVALAALPERAPPRSPSVRRAG